MNFDLTTRKIKAITDEFGSSGKAWVDNYPTLLKECTERWDLELLDTASAGLAINIIFFCENGEGKSVVLKIGHPHPEQKTEIIALLKYAGRHITRIIDWHEASGSFLMDRVSPGVQFRDVTSDINRSKIQIPLFRDLSLPLESVDGLPSFGDWIERGFAEFRVSHPGSRQAESDREFLSFIENAEVTYASLRERYPRNYLLHGDLHHENILQDESGGWRAIDPKGVIGPQVMECGRFLHNFIEDEIPGVNTLKDATEEQIAQVFKVRFETLSTIMAIDPPDIIAAGYVDLVLGSCWSINSKQEVDFRRIRVLREFL